MERHPHVLYMYHFTEHVYFSVDISDWYIPFGFGFMTCYLTISVLCLHLSIEFREEHEEV